MLMEFIASGSRPAGGIGRGGAQGTASSLRRNFLLRSKHFGQSMQSGSLVRLRIGDRVYPLPVLFPH